MYYECRGRRDSEQFHRLSLQLSSYLSVEGELSLPLGRPVALILLLIFVLVDVVGTGGVVKVFVLDDLLNTRHASRIIAELARQKENKIQPLRPFRGSRTSYSVTLGPEVTVATDTSS